jgi:catechol 2,3-dioxygenase-like lactoylglutathione lyase family enzyme
VQDCDEAIEFYVEILGFELIEDSPMNDTRRQELRSCASPVKNPTVRSPFSETCMEIYGNIQPGTEVMQDARTAFSQQAIAPTGADADVTKRQLTRYSPTQYSKEPSL